MLTNAKLLIECLNEYWRQLEKVASTAGKISLTASYMCAISFDYIARGDY